MAQPQIAVEANTNTLPNLTNSFRTRPHETYCRIDALFVMQLGRMRAEADGPLAHSDLVAPHWLKHSFSYVVTSRNRCIESNTRFRAVMPLKAQKLAAKLCCAFRPFARATEFPAWPAALGLGLASNLVRRKHEISATAQNDQKALPKCRVFEPEVYVLVRRFHVVAVPLFSAGVQRPAGRTGLAAGGCHERVVCRQCAHLHQHVYLCAG